MFDEWKAKRARKEVEFIEKAQHVKSEYIKSIMGKQHDMVGHSPIPFKMGGALDEHYYPNYCDGTAIVTKELTDHRFDSPKNDVYDAYELVMITRNKIHSITGKFALEYDDGPISRILNTIGKYSAMAKLNPFETLEYNDGCLIILPFSEPLCNLETYYKKFGLMLLIEIHRDEMEYAMQSKSTAKDLIEKLKQSGVYPFTGIKRPSVLAAS